MQRLFLSDLPKRIVHFLEKYPPPYKPTAQVHDFSAKPQDLSNDSNHPLPKTYNLQLTTY
jgi:hypothetical protein